MKMINTKYHCIWYTCTYEKILCKSMWL